MENGSSDNNTRKTVLDTDKKFSIENPQNSFEKQADWHPADIKAALEKRGYSLASLSREAGYSPTAAGRTLRTEWPAMQEIIAEALGVSPQEIWPSRYDSNGVPNKYQPRRRK